MPKYLVKDNLRHNGKRYRTDGEIELDAEADAKTIARLTKLGVIVLATATDADAVAINPTDDPNDRDFLTYVAAARTDDLRNALKHPQANTRPLQRAAIEAEIASRESAANQQAATNTSGDGNAPAAGDSSTNVADAAGVGGDSRAETATAPATPDTNAKAKPAKNKGGKS